MGRLPNIDMLPPEADEAWNEAVVAVRARRRPKKEIHRLFNDRLAALGISPVSRSAFFRWSLAVLQEAPRLRGAPASTSPAHALSCPTCGAALNVRLLKGGAS